MLWDSCESLGLLLHGIAVCNLLVFVCIPLFQVTNGVMHISKATVASMLPLAFFQGSVRSTMLANAKDSKVKNYCRRWLNGVDLQTCNHLELHLDLLEGAYAHLTNGCMCNEC